MPHWTVNFSAKAGKQYSKLKASGSRPSINDVIDLLVLDLQKNGPHYPNGPTLVHWRKIISIVICGMVNQPMSHAGEF